MKNPTHDDAQLVLKTAKQLASGLIQAIAMAHGLSQTQLNQLRHDRSAIHFHDGSTNEISWNDVDAILKYNEATGENIPVPLVASEGYNQHYHTSFADGGFIDFNSPRLGFAVYSPGTSLSQQAYAI